MIASGRVQLSYWAASARKTNSTDRPKMKTAVLPVCLSCKASSVHSKEVPDGSVSAAIFSIAASASPLATPGAALPCTGTETYML